VYNKINTTGKNLFSFILKLMINISVLPRQDLSLAMYMAMQARGFAVEAPI
jgi:hypothetical protein